MVQGNAVDWFVDRHLRDGDGARVAFQDPWRILTYAALETATRQFAGALQTTGIGRERRIVLLLQDTIEFPIAFWGAMRAGVVPVPINTLLTPETVAYILQDSRAEGVVVSAGLTATLGATLLAAGLKLVIVSESDGSQPTLADASWIGFQALLANGDPATPTVTASPDEVAFWLYSSGSTGAPKGVRHVHSSLRFTADTYGAQVLGIRPDDVMFSAAKAFHAYGLGNSLTFPQSVGATTVFLPDRPTPDAVLEVMRTHNPTLFGGVPTLYAALLANPYIMPGAGSPRLRRCISAGEALPADIGNRWKSIVGVDILDGIGSTEMLHIFISNRPDDIRYGTSGKPVPGYEARIVGEYRSTGGARRSRRTRGARRQRGGRLLEPAIQDPPHVPGRVDLYRRHLYPRRRGLFPLPGPQRRDAEGQRRLGLAVRGRGGPDLACGGPGSRDHRPARPGRADQAEGIRDLTRHRPRRRGAR